jgi:hypothetical protein
MSAKALVSYCNINDFSTANQWNIRAGEPNTLYFQLVDIDQAGLRRLLGVGAGNTPFGVNVVFPSLDDRKVITAIGVQADPNDSSIWSVSIASSQIPSSGNVRFTVTEGTTVRNFTVTNLLSVEHPGSEGCDGPLPDSGTFNYLP